MSINKQRADRFGALLPHFDAINDEKFRDVEDRLINLLVDMRRYVNAHDMNITTIRNTAEFIFGYEKCSLPGA